MCYEGIYQKNGDPGCVAQLLQGFTKDARVVKLRAQDHRVEDVTDTLKSFLSHSEDALLAKELYPFWISALGKCCQPLNLFLWMSTNLCLIIDKTALKSSVIEGAFSSSLANFAALCVLYCKYQEFHVNYTDTSELENAIYTIINSLTSQINTNVYAHFLSLSVFRSFLLLQPYM